MTSFITPQCEFDRVQFLAQAVGHAVPPHFPGFERLGDRFVRAQTKVKTYQRVSQYKNPSSGTGLFLQYQPTFPKLPAFKGTIIPSDQHDLSREEIQQVVGQFREYRLLLFEVAFNFPTGSGIGLGLVRRSGLFGKSRPNRLRLHKHGALYGSRKARKLVRCYHKRELGVFRIELEIHSAWLRHYGIITLQDLRRLPQLLFPKHIQFVDIDCAALREHLSRRRMNSRQIVRQLKNRTSIHDAIDFLRDSIGIHNPHRLLVTVAPSQEIRKSLKNWARQF